MSARTVHLTLLALVLSCAVPARADLTDICLGAYEHAQVFRRDGKLRQAREQLLLCAQTSCPQATRSDCVPWLAEVERQLPTVVVSAKDASGVELTDVQVSFDSMQVAHRLDGRAVPVDPGEHTLRLEVAGHPPYEHRVVIREGEHDRALAVAVPWSLRPTPPAGQGPTQAEPHRRGLHPGPAVYALGGVAALALGGFAYFGLTGAHDANHLRDTCYPHCSEADVAYANRELLVADVSLGVALVAAGVATYLLLRSADSSVAASAHARAWELAAGRVRF